MIAVDTSSFVAYLGGETGKDVDLLEEVLLTKQAVLPPVVLCELLSDPSLPKDVVDLFQSLPLLEVSEAYWERAGFQRAKVLATGQRARLADTLIAQSCIDHKVGLLTRDEDFQGFSESCGLVLVS